jgi:Tol biopolymer transport system component
VQLSQVYEQTENQIWLADETGTSKTLESQPFDGRAPSWSPIGHRTVIESTRGNPNSFYGIFVVNRDGAGLTQVTDYPMNANRPVFSPDGHTLVFAMGNPSKKEENIAFPTLMGECWIFVRESIDRITLSLRV